MERKIEYTADNDSGFNFVDNGSMSRYQPPQELNQEAEKKQRSKLMKWINKMIKEK